MHLSHLISVGAYRIDNLIVSRVLNLLSNYITINKNLVVEWATGDCDVSVVQLNYGINLGGMILRIHLLIDVCMLTSSNSIRMQRVSTINGNVVLPDRHFGSQSLFRILAQVHFCQSF